MRKNLQKHAKFQLSKHLTPDERQALWMVIALFLLGLIVRWYRLSHP